MGVMRRSWAILAQVVPSSCHEPYPDHICYQFRILRNLRIDIKDRLEDYNLRRLTSSTRSSSTSSFRSTLSDLKRGQQYLGALVAVVRSIRYMYITAKVW